MAAETILYSAEDGVATFNLNRPEKCKWIYYSRFVMIIRN